MPVLASSSLINATPAVDDLISGKIRTQPVTLAAGTYLRGQVLGLTGLVYGALTAPGTNAAAVMPHDVVLAAQGVSPVYIEGDFNEDALIYTGSTLADVKVALRKVGIMARKWGAA